jgi:hypothetical protein
MNQADFRQVLVDAKRQKEEKAAEQATKTAAPKAKKKRSFRDYQAAKDEAAEKKADEVKYRDRAKERSTLQGEQEEGEYFGNADYDGINKAMELDIEHSKYLGGDVQHTHLVKGLDFALLTKVRSELTTLRPHSGGGKGGKEASVKGGQGGKGGQGKGGQGKGGKDDEDSPVKQEVARPGELQNITTNSRMARCV